MNLIATQTTIYRIYILIEPTKYNLRYLISHYVKCVLVTKNVEKYIGVPLMPSKLTLRLWRVRPNTPALPPRFTQNLSFGS
jgi:hypothetical protein